MEATKSLVKWVDPDRLTIESDDESTTLPDLGYIPVIPLSSLTELVEGAIDAEEEMPGEIPQEMYDTIINGDKEIVAEALRIVARATKKGIKQRLLTQLEAHRKEG